MTDSNLDFCFFCQEKSEIVGHSYLNCPRSVCKECGISGHIIKNCPVLLHADDFRKLTTLSGQRPVEATKSPIYEPTSENVPINEETQETSEGFYAFNEEHKSQNNPDDFRRLSMLSRLRPVAAVTDTTTALPSASRLDHSPIYKPTTSENVRIKEETERTDTTTALPSASRLNHSPIYDPTTSENVRIKEETEKFCELYEEYKSKKNCQAQLCRPEATVTNTTSPLNYSSSLPLPVPARKERSPILTENQEEIERDESNEMVCEDFNNAYQENFKIKVHNEYYTKPSSTSQERQPRRRSRSRSRSKSNSKSPDRRSRPEDRESNWRSRSRDRSKSRHRSSSSRSGDRETRFIRLLDQRSRSRDRKGRSSSSDNRLDEWEDQVLEKRSRSIERKMRHSRSIERRIRHTEQRLRDIDRRTRQRRSKSRSRTRSKSRERERTSRSGDKESNRRSRDRQKQWTWSTG